MEGAVTTVLNPSCSRRTVMNTSRRRKVMTTLTLDTEGLEDLVVEQLPKARGGQLAPLRHRRRMANVLLQMTGPNGVVNAVPLDLAPRIRPRMLLLLQNQRGRRQMKVVSVHTQMVILQKVLDLLKVLHLPLNPPSSLPNKLMGGRRANFGITPWNPSRLLTGIPQTVNSLFMSRMGMRTTTRWKNRHWSSLRHCQHVVSFRLAAIFHLLPLAHPHIVCILHISFTPS